MIEIKQTKWENLTIRNLAEITAEARRYEGIGDHSIDQIETFLKNMNERFPAEIVLLAVEGEKILGWLGIERSTEVIGILGRWQPYVAPEAVQEHVARRLISEINAYAQGNGMTRMEIGFGEINEKNQDAFEKRCSWYEAEGWSKLDDCYFMAVNPVENVKQETSLPEGFILRPLVDVNNDTIFRCYLESFTTGQASWIYDMTEEQIRQEFDRYFDRAQDINEAASFIVESNGVVLGFALVISRSDEEEHLESIGVHSSARGIGLGKHMLWRVMMVLRDQNVSNLTLGVDPVNIPAVKLYEKYGFDVVSRTVNYSWKVDD